MSTSQAVKPTVLVLGSTGGCVLAFLIRALNAGYNCNALVRTPSKLSDLLESNNVSADVIARHLTIFQGDAKDTAKISEALLVNNRVVDVIVSGVGQKPKPAANLLRPPMDDPNICKDVASATLEAIRSTSPTKKPILVAISTTGITRFGRDIPIAMIPLYHWMLPIPHSDKREMEKVLAQDAQSVSPSVRGFISIRPSLLTDGSEKGVAKVRVGLESLEKFESGAIGYTISREDVGNWIFEKVLREEDSAERYLNHFVTLSY